MEQLFDALTKLKPIIDAEEAFSPYIRLELFDDGSGSLAVVIGVDDVEAEESFGSIKELKAMLNRIVPPITDDAEGWFKENKVGGKKD